MIWPRITLQTLLDSDSAIWSLPRSANKYEHQIHNTLLTTMIHSSCFDVLLILPTNNSDAR